MTERMFVVIEFDKDGQVDLSQGPELFDDKAEALNFAVGLLREAAFGETYRVYELVEPSDV